MKWMSREQAVPLTGKGNAVLPPACNFQPQQSIVILNLPLSEQEGSVLPLGSSLLTHYLSCLKGERRKQEAGLQSLQGCSTDCLILTSSACHHPSSHGEGWSTVQGRAVHTATKATAAAHLCMYASSQGSAPRAAHGLGRVRNTHPWWGIALVPRSGKERLPTYEQNQCVREVKDAAAPWWSAGTSPECEHPHLPSPFQQNPLLSISEQPQVPMEWGKASENSSSNRRLNMHSVKIRGPDVDTGMAKYSWLKTYFVRLN